MPSQQHEDDGTILIQRLAPDHVDVVLSSHPGKQKIPSSKSSWSLSSLVIVLALLLAGGYFISKLMAPKPRAVAVAVAPVPETEPTLERPAEQPPIAAVEPIRTQEQVIYIAPKIEAAQADDDDAPPRSQGMVSDRYMAQYKAGATQTKAANSGRHYEVAGVFIREIDGRNRYEARFRIFNNHIENSSVCFNFTSGSVEYNECRRAAAPFFKDMCSDWTKRSAKDKGEKSKLAQEKYCEAASTYIP